MLNFTTQKRTVNINGTKQTKYNAKLVRKGTIGMEEIGKKVELLSTLHGSEARLAVDVIVDVMINAITNGQTVDLGKLGRFKASIKSKTKDTPEEVNAASISGVTCIFKPGKEIKKRLNETAIHREKEMSEKAKKMNSSINFFSKKEKLIQRLKKYEETEKKLKESGIIEDIYKENP